MSKIFEKCVLNQLVFHISFHDLFVPNQYGFRSGSNTTDCLVDLIEEITNSLDKSEFAVTLLLDLSKAFDTVNHSILSSKLSHYGITDLENLWFKSYLQHRRQRVYVNGVLSDIQSISLGVPQGSILGLILFLFILMILLVLHPIFLYASLLMTLHLLHVMPNPQILEYLYYQISIAILFVKSLLINSTSSFFELI